MGDEQVPKPMRQRRPRAWLMEAVVEQADGETRTEHHGHAGDDIRVGQGMLFTDRQMLRARRRML